MYGDDCAPATNYPVVRLRNSSTGKVYYCRSYDFSTLGVATGASLQSARFTAAGVSYGEYDLFSIPTEISSHCVSFCHRKPVKPCCHDTKKDSCCCQEDPCGCCERESDTEVVVLRGQVKRLQNSVNRLASVMKGEGGPAQAKETKDEEEKDRKEKKGKK